MKAQKRVVIKIGTKVITSHDRALDKDRLKDIVGQVADIQASGTKVIIVTSGAIGAGLWLLGMKKRPSGNIAQLQAAAAIGQGHLMHLYSEYFKARGHTVGQVLLTQEDFNDRKRFLNIKHTLNALLAHNVIPIINENDTVATDEIRCGDNDRISCLVSDICQAAKLVILTDVDGLLDEDGRVVKRIDKITPKLLKLAGNSACDLGTGGMSSKLECARSVAEAGIDCIIANGKRKGILTHIMAGADAGTVISGIKAKLAARERWIACSSRPKGSVRVDDGAVEAIRKRHTSLLASGIIMAEGSFRAGDVISIAAPDGNEIARGIANYSSADIVKIKGLKTGKFKEILGYKGPDEVVHKDDLVVLL